MTLATLLLIGALICFIIACIPPLIARFNWVALGLALWVASILFADIHLR
jgi:hypothetical protein